MNNSKRGVLTKIVEMYADVFRVKPLIISYSFDDDRDQVRSVEDYLNRQAPDVAIGEGFALARHGFNDGLLMYDRLIMERFWRTTAMWAEGNWSYSAVKDDGVHGTLEENIHVFSRTMAFLLNSRGGRAVLRLGLLGRLRFLRRGKGRVLRARAPVPEWEGGPNS